MSEAEKIKIYVFDGVTGQIGYFLHNEPIRTKGSSGPSWNNNPSPKWVFSDNVKNMPEAWQSAYKYLPAAGWYFAEKRNDKWEFSPGSNPEPDFTA